jgi:(1->4)-alpha-D-glucan 1-alpha-D-glucosylmutase
MARGGVSESLRQLASAVGIGGDYEDAWGNRHAVSDATLLALLTSMGVAPSDGEPGARLLELQRDRWREVLPPLSVVRRARNGDPSKLALRLPQALLDGAPTLVLTCEEGVRFCVDYTAAVEQIEAAEIDGTTFVALAWPIPDALPIGYHRVDLVVDGKSLASARLALAPTDCYRPALLENGQRVWGPAVQLYGVRSERNWGVGDFTDLAGIVRTCAAHGAAFVGTSPLHALYPGNPEHNSPYSPSSRLYTNVLALDAEAIADFHECDAARSLVASGDFQSTLARLRETDLVDYERVARVKLPVLRLLHRHFRDTHLAQSSARAAEFRDFVRDHGPALARHATFDALQGRLQGADEAIWGWPAWPDELKDPNGAAVARFADEHADDIEFYAYLQWQAELQRTAVAAVAEACGMPIGVYADLAVSIDRGGAEAWANQRIYAAGASVGAPPDAFNAQGQDWGLPPIVPERLREAGYAPFIETLRANMRHAGALRIDHVMGLMRLYWIPLGQSAANGAYVSYPFDDLLGLLALESHRHRCLVIGEDLGTVPRDIRRVLAENLVLSYRVLLFERDDAHGFYPPDAYPPLALVTASTHDLPTLAGWWEGRDIALRAEYGLLSPGADRERSMRERELDRGHLLRAIERASLLPAGVDVAAPPAVLDAELAGAIHRYLAASPSALMVVQPEDLFGVCEQANLPGTTEAAPNWRRKLPVALERWQDESSFRATASDLGSARNGRRQTARIPRATYRLQLHSGFTFADAADIVPYLSQLGVSHVYCSPYLRARPGSTHGYDIVDHSALNPEIGSAADFDRFISMLRQHRMSHVADLVPNHMGVMGADNAWWMDVLENGPASEYAHFFDIDWSPLDVELAGRVLVPVLGTPYGQALESGDLTVVDEPATGSFAVRYFEHRFPLDPGTYPQLLDDVVAALGPERGANASEVVAALRALPSRDTGDAVERDRRRREVARLKSRLAALAADASWRAAIDGRLAQLNDRNHATESADALHRLLEAQAFRLAHWRVAFDEINYRRFFDINDLAALRMEHGPAFEATHDFLLGLAAAGVVDGLRVDHPDGLYDPAAYFEKLQQAYVERAGLAAEAHGRPIYVVAEKITAPHERLPEAWAVHGTTGYRFANTVNGLFVDTTSCTHVDRVWRAFVGADAGDFETIAYQAKRATVRGPLAAGATVLANQALRIARADRHTRDYTLAGLRRAIEEVAAGFPVYRTYVSADGASAQDRRYVDWAIARARRHGGAPDLSVYDFLRRLLLGEPADPALADACLSFAMRFQQFTAPVAAKGIEDTSFYRFNRLLSLADVGGDPDQFGMTVRAFHGASLDRATHWPATMLATSTHDNKRSEDVRARINVISEIPAAWRLMVRRWARFNRSRKRTIEDARAPSRNDEYLLYQTLIGSFPDVCFGTALADYRTRIDAYMGKAIREAKVHTSWTTPNEEYEEATRRFVEAVLADGDNLFLDDLREQLPFFSWFGALASLSIALIKFASPGVPDIYQGNELSDFSLVDPDNRRPVDYAARRAVLGQLHELARQSGASLAGGVRSLAESVADGRAKLWTINRLLQFRRAHSELFDDSDYLPISVVGAHGTHAIAFARRIGDEGLLVAAGRLHATLGISIGQLPLAEVWGDTALQTDLLGDVLHLKNLLTGEALRADAGLPLAVALRDFPVAAFHYRCSSG